MIWAQWIPFCKSCMRWSQRTFSAARRLSRASGVSVRRRTGSVPGQVNLSRLVLFDAIHHGDDVGAGLPLNVQDDRGSLVHPGGLADVLGVIEDGGNIGQFDGCAVLVGDDEWSVIARGEQLVVGSNLVRLVRAVEVSFGLIDVGGDDGGAQILEIETV